MWTDVMDLKVTEFNSTKADIVIGFYNDNHFEGGFEINEIAHSFQPGGPFFLYGDIHIKYDVPYSAFSFQGKEFKIHGLLKCLCPWCSSVCLLWPSICLSVCLPVFMSTCLFIYACLYSFLFVCLCLSGY